MCCRVDHSQNQKRLYIMTLGCLAPYRRLGIGKISFLTVFRVLVCPQLFQRAFRSQIPCDWMHGCIIRLLSLNDAWHEDLCNPLEQWCLNFVIWTFSSYWYVSCHVCLKEQKCWTMCWTFVRRMALLTTFTCESENGLVLYLLWNIHLCLIHIMFNVDTWVTM